MVLSPVRSTVSIFHHNAVIWGAGWLPSSDNVLIASLPSFPDGSFLDSGLPWRTVIINLLFKHCLASAVTLKTIQSGLRVHLTLACGPLPPPYGMTSPGSFASWLMLSLKLLINLDTNHWCFLGTLWPQAFWSPPPFHPMVVDHSLRWLVQLHPFLSAGSWITYSHLSVLVLSMVHCLGDPNFCVLAAAATIIIVFISEEEEGRDWERLVIYPAFGKGTPWSPPTAWSL